MRSHRATTTRLPRSPNAAGLIRLARALADSGSHIEDEFWSAQMAAELKRILQQGSDAPIHAALEFLWDSEGYASIYRLTKKASQALASGSLSVSKPEDWPEALPFLADSRFVVGAIAAPEGAPLFRWQTIGATPQIKRSDCIEEWKTRGSVALANMLSNCAYEMVEPGAFFSSTRATEREIRGFSLKASVSFLHMSLDLAPPAQQAVVARCQDGEFEEYRIGFCKLGQTQVLHGAIWPLLGPELDNPEEPNEIETALRLAGISSIIHIDTLLPAEFCSDCGVPLYPNPEGELLHAEVSAEAENSESSVHQALH